MNPLISVIIPVYNGDRYLAEAIGSIRKQNYDRLEIIIVDDGSTDATADIVAGLSDQNIMGAALVKRWYSVQE
jgi:glycosyltransferase involved in cell wall biosynthesis